VNIHIKGKGPVSLTTRDFIASGGEGSVYAKGGQAFKIYTDPAKMIATQKIQELGSLTLPNIIRPVDVLLNDNNLPIGYSMRHLSNTNALCQVFTKAFRDRNNITNEQIIKLVQNMQGTVDHVHQHNILIVDLNEMNFLIDDKFKDIYFIDVDSWQTKSFPATAIMESVKDRHANGKWTKETDWFSFGIVSFQMFVGIHPYKGKHPTLNGFDERMLANASVFRKNVTYPKVVLPFSVIPQNYLDWYKAVFEDGKRLPPPTDLVATIVITTTVRKISGTDNFEIKEMFVLPEEIIGYGVHGGTRIAMTKDSVFVNGQRQSVKLQKGSETFAAVTPKLSNVILGYTESGNLNLFDTGSKKVIPTSIAAERITSYEGRMYYKSGGSVFELQWMERVGDTKAAPRLVANVHENATKLFDGVAMQNLLGKHYATIFPESNKSYTIALPEISGQIMDAKFDRNVLMVISANAKKVGNKQDIEYNRHVFRFDAGYVNHDHQLATVKEFVPLNFVVLDTGNCCSINEDENVVIFRNKKDDALVKIIDDPSVRGDVRLFRNETQAVFAKGDTLYSLRMK
jgi:hypothetical protein